jgi:hypothetical protein
LHSAFAHDQQGCCAFAVAQLAQLLAFQLPSWWFHCGAAGADALV